MQGKNLITLVDASERYDKSVESFWVSACLIKKSSGKFPDWYVIDVAGKGKINTYHYEKWAGIERKAWLHSTNDLYYILSYDLRCTDTQIARFMARHSKKFTNFASWSAFLTKALFSLPQDSILQKRLSMTIEFFYMASYMIKVLLDNEDSKIVFKELPQIP